MAFLIDCMTSKEAAEKWAITLRRVQLLYVKESMDMFHFMVIQRL
jgi:hypothetical protein